MKNIVVICLFIIKIGISFGQSDYDNITYLDSIGKIVNQEQAVYKKVIKDYNLEQSIYQYNIFYKSDKIKEQGNCLDKYCLKKTGLVIDYYENGNNKEVVRYEDNQKLGKVDYWYENGTLMEQGEFFLDDKNTKYRITNFWNKNETKTIENGTGFYSSKDEFYSVEGHYVNGNKSGIWNGKHLKSNDIYQETYENGNLISGDHTDAAGIRYHYTQLEIKPEPKKGMNDFRKYIGQNFKPSEESIRLKINGKIILSFVVDIEGRVVEPTIIKSLRNDLDQEAIRVLTSYTNWNPAMRRGKKVRCSYQIPIVLQN